MKIALLVSYDGTQISGWQMQKNVQSVQSFLEDAVYAAFSQKVRIVGSGRTDAGVHASGQVCSFILDNNNIKPEKVANALNIFLPENIRVIKSAKVDDDFDACRHAKLKTYRYAFYVCEHQNPLKERYATQLKVMPDVELMKQAALKLVGEHDFKAFCASKSSVKTTVREIISVNVKSQESFGTCDIIIEVCGKGFLYNMVRIIAGTLVEIGLKKRNICELEKALETGNRELAGRTMSPKGLTLINVDYGKDIF